MEKSNFNITPTIFTLTLLILISISIPLINSQEFSTKLSKNKLGLKKDKATHLHFYFHDIVSGKNQTSVLVAEASTTNTSSTFFGEVRVIDAPLTLTPNVGSKIVGRAQGIYTLASINDISLLMVMNLVFLEGKYNGSVLSVSGRNWPSETVREMPIVGGSGVFRFARGYVQAKLHEFDSKIGHVNLEFNACLPLLMSLLMAFFWG